MRRRAALIGVAWLASLPAWAAMDQPVGAASCTGCHAPAGRAQTALPMIAGRNADELTAAMEAFRTGERPATLMDRIVKGFTPAEVRAISAWLAAQG